jgi:TonB family protein
MKSQFLVPVHFIVICVSGLIMVTAGCNNKNEETPTEDINSSASITDTPMVSDHMSADTAMMNTSFGSDVTRGMKGTAKPNPTKKGMKGKVIVEPAPKLKGNMEADNLGVYTNVEVYPAYPGGGSAMQEFFNKNMVYPDPALNEGVEGTVNLMFTVDENGKLTNPHIMGNTLGYGLEEEALRVVGKMPAWSPGKLKGKNVKTRYSLPVVFQLY